MIEMKDNPEIFFGHLLELGAGEYDYFTSFKESQIVGAVEYRNIVPELAEYTSGICAMFVMEDGQVRVILEARIPKRVSKKILEDLFKSDSDRIASKIGMALEWQEPSEKYGCYRVSITHEFPSIRTDRTFNNFLESLSSSMNEMVMALRSYE